MVTKVEVLLTVDGLDVAQSFPFPLERTKRPVGNITEGSRNGSKWLLNSRIHFRTRGLNVVPRDVSNEVLSKHWWPSQGFLLFLSYHRTSSCTGSALSPVHGSV